MADFNNINLSPVTIDVYSVVRPMKEMSLISYLGAVNGPTYTMRAYHTVAPVGYVYWDSPGEPDDEAAVAPYPPGELTDIVVIREVLPG